MASMRKNKNGHWDIGIQSLGLNTTLSTKTKKKTDAERIRRKIESRIDAVKLDGMHPYYDWSKKEQRAWAKTGYKPKIASEKPVTVAEAIEEYLSFMRGQNKAYNTIQGYVNDLAPAKKRFGNTPLRDLTSRLLQEWVTDLSKTVITSGSNRGETLSVRTQRVKVSALKRVVKHLLRLGDSSLNTHIFNSISYRTEDNGLSDILTPWIDFEGRVTELERLNIDPSTPNAFQKVILTEHQSQEQLGYLRTKLFDDGSLSTIRTYTAIFFSCCTGARRSEIARVRRRDLFLEGDRPSVTLLRKKGRGNKSILPHKLILPNKLVPVIERLLRLLPKNQECIFTSDDAHYASNVFNEKLDRGKAEYLGEQLLNALKGSKWEHASGWHKYRHSLASRMLEVGYSKTETKELIGWCNDEIAEKYLHQTLDRKATIINKLF